MASDTEYIWVIGAYDPRSDRGKSVLSHADHGIGYVLLNKDRGKSERVIVGFKHPTVRPVPNYLTVATDEQAYKLEKRTSRG